MTAIITRNEPNPTVPTKDDGTTYRFEMIYLQGKHRAYADTAPELLSVLIPGYTDLTSEEDRDLARITYATGLLAPLQATYIHGHDTTGLTDADRATLFQPRHEPVTIDQWEPEVPLVLLDAHYIPYTDTPAPTTAKADVQNPTNIIWLRATDDFALLISLLYAGFIDLSESADYTV